MRRLILSVLLSFAQTPSAVSPKAPDHTETTAPAKNKDSHNAARPEAAQQPVRVRELPPVSITKDWTDRAYWAFSLLLVVVGSFQTWLLYRTFKTVSRQAVSMRRQTTVFRESLAVAKQNAESARLSAEATQMTALAARDSAKVARDTLYLTQAAEVHILEVILLPKGLLSGDTRFSVVIKNQGHTRAENFTEDLNIGIKERATSITQPTRDIERVVGAGDTRSIIFGPLQTGLSSADLEMVLGGQLLLKIWGSLKYTDIFGNNHVIDCECTYRPSLSNFVIDRYSHHESDAQANQGH